MPSDRKLDQLPLDLGSTPSFTRDDLIASTSNHEATVLIDSWPQWASPWAVLTGAAGSGKTHLANIWASGADAHAVNPTDISEDDLDVAQQGQPILIDGLSEGSFDETKLFHLMNAVRNANSSLLITADTAPEYWTVKTPDLMSRFKAATTTKIAEPDDMLLQGVIGKLFADRQLDVEADVIGYLVNRVERSLAAARQCVDRIDQLALAKKARITKALVRQTLEDVESGQQNLDV